MKMAKRSPRLIPTTHDSRLQALVDAASDLTAAHEMGMLTAGEWDELSHVLREVTTPADPRPASFRFEAGGYLVRHQGGPRPSDRRSLQCPRSAYLAVAQALQAAGERPLTVEETRLQAEVGWVEAFVTMDFLASRGLLLVIKRRYRAEVDNVAAAAEREWPEPEQAPQEKQLQP
jgi:hypothetical protein